MGLFNGGVGDDVITPAFVSATVNAGPGARPSNDSDTINGSAGNDTIDGSGGNNVITGGPGADLLKAGGGADTFIWNPGDGSDTIDGGSGFDTLQFNTSNVGEKITLTGFAVGLASGHTLLTRDVAAIAMDLSNIQHVAFGGGPVGADSFTIGDLSATAVRQVDIDLGTDGDSDSVTVTGRNVDDHITLSTSGKVITVGGLAAAVNVTDTGATDQITIAGAIGNDTLDASAFGGGVTVNFDGGFGNDELLLKGAAGADTVMFFGAASGPNGDAISFNINGGAGQLFNVRDVETVLFDAGAGDDVINASGQSRGLTLAGGAGNDTITSGRGGDLLRGDDGNDRFVWNPGEGSDTVDGGSGVDTLLFNGANVNEIMTLGADAAGNAILTRNVAAVTMTLDKVEHLSIETVSGQDQVTVGELAGTNLKTVDVDLNATGGVGDTLVDTVTVVARTTDDHLTVATANGATTVGGLAAAVNVTTVEVTDQVAILGLTGNDTLDSSGFAGGVTVNFDGGAGTDVLLLKGTAGADTVMFFGAASGPNGDAISFNINGGAGQLFNALNVETVLFDAGAGDDVINASGQSRGLTLAGGAGNDTITSGRGGDLLRGDDGNDRFVWNPGEGSDTVDGGSGVDTLLFNGANIAETMTLGADAAGNAILTRNVAAVTMTLDNVEHLSIETVSGQDIVTVSDLSATSLKTVNIDLNATGGAGDASSDTVSVFGRAIAERIVVSSAAGVTTVAGLGETVNVATAEAFDRLAVNGGAGDDTLDATAFSGGVTLTLAGGAGSDRFVFGSSAGVADQVVDFQVHGGGATGDFIVLKGFADHSFAALQANHHIAQSGADVVISEAGLTLTLKNVLLSSLTAGDFLSS